MKLNAIVVMEFKRGIPTSLNVFSKNAEGWREAEQLFCDAIKRHHPVPLAQQELNYYLAREDYDDENGYNVIIKES